MKIFLLGFAFLLTSCAPGNRVYTDPLRMVVKVPVTNVRSKPIPHSREYKYDPLQETQIEQGEPVYVYERKGGWVRIEAPEQIEFSHNNKWQGYPGWVEAKALTSDLKQHHQLKRSNLTQKELRKKVLSQAELHIGSPYLWGGRSLYDPRNEKEITGVDCSGLVNWSFRQVGWYVPRDSHEQYLKAREIDPQYIRPGDLIFLAKTKNPKKIVHVGFYDGEGKMLEAPYTGEKVRKISFEERFGKRIDVVKNGEKVGNRILYFGSFFPEGE